MWGVPARGALRCRVPPTLSGQGQGISEKEAPRWPQTHTFPEVSPPTSPLLLSRPIVTSSGSTSACPCAYTLRNVLPCPVVKPVMHQALGQLRCQGGPVPTGPYHGGARKEGPMTSLCWRKNVNLSIWC